MQNFEKFENVGPGWNPVADPRFDRL